MEKWCTICNRMTDDFCEEKCGLYYDFSKEDEDFYPDQEESDGRDT